jgi:hypothetical protein
MKKQPQSNVISNNIFTGVQWDGQALEAVNNVSKALLNLTKLFRSQNIKIEMIKINADQTDLMGNTLIADEDNG